MGSQTLESHVPSKLRVLSAVHFAHSACAQALANQETSSHNSAKGFGSRTGRRYRGLDLRHWGPRGVTGNKAKGAGPSLRVSPPFVGRMLLRNQLASK